MQEVDPTKSTEDSTFLKNLGVDGSDENGNFLGDIISSVPGIDEATSFGEVIKMVDSLKYDLVIFDTAPTGHTLRLLNFPNILDKALSKLVQLKDKIGPMVGQISTMMGAGEGGKDGFTTMFEKIEDFKKSIKVVNDQFQDPKQTTFVAV